MSAKRKLNVDLSGLEEAFDNGSSELTYYLDLETGKVVLVTQDMREQVEDILENVDEDAPIEAVIQAINAEEMPDWDESAVIEAVQVEWGLGTRYVAIPRSDSREGYQDMEAFIETVGNERLRENLEIAIRGKGAFRRFKD